MAKKEDSYLSCVTNGELYFSMVLAFKPFGLEFEMSVHQIYKFGLFWTDLIQKNPKIKWPFLFFLKM